MFPQVQQAVRADYMQGYEITERMRALLIDWLVQVHSRFQLLQETLYLTVAILDRFLQVRAVCRAFCLGFSERCGQTPPSSRRRAAGPAGLSQEAAARRRDGHAGGL